jgi:EAL and modified HD-GYP domain-containing signal transduction protein
MRRTDTDIIMETLSPRDTVYVARQPILHASGQVFGYELLYRGTAIETSCLAPGDTASARVLTDAVLNLGLDTLTDNMPAFLNLNRNLLLAGTATLLSPGAVVFELLEDMPIDQEVIETCRRLRAMGYALALDDFAIQSDAEELLPYVKFVKVDVLRTTPGQRADLAKRLLPLGLRLIAEKVESSDIADEVRASGYNLLQGYYFCKPTTFGAKALPASSLAYLNLLAALNKPDLCAGELEDLIKQDVSLSHRVLRCINSAAFGLRQEIRSIRQALVLLGLGKIQRWASIWSLAGLNHGGVPETVTVALVRARSCELLGNALSGADTGSEFFLLGLCSLLDVMLGRSMHAALADLPLSAGIRSALLGQPNIARSVLDSVIAYERGQWDTANSTAQDAGLSSTLLPVAYADALRWARELSLSSQAA